jgi:hypothetical protein
MYAAAKARDGFAAGKRRSILKSLKKSGPVVE